jgi:hypothetical protein
MRTTSVIDNVLVYDNGALVTRVGKGHGWVELQGLPLLLAPESLRVSCAHRCSAVEELAFVTSSEAVSSRDSRAQVDKLEQQVSTLQARIERNEQLASSLSQTLGLDAVATGPSPASGAWHWLDGMHAARRRLMDAVQHATEELAGVQRAVRHADEQANRAPTHTLTRGIRFHVDSQEPVTFQVEYFVHHVRLEHAFALMMRTGGAAQLSHSVRVAQSTGEDWLNVQLRIAQGSLQRVHQTPHARSWRLGVAQPEPSQGTRSLPTDLGELFAGYDRFAAPVVSAAPTGAMMRTDVDDMDDDVDDMEGEAEPQSDGAFRDSTSAEVESFARQRSRPPMAKMSMEPMEVLDEAPPVMRSKRREAPAASRGMAPPMAPAPALSAPPSAGARAPMPAKPRQRVPTPSSGVLRMMGPEQAQRGQLVALDEVEQWLWLLGEGAGNTPVEHDHHEHGITAHTIRHALENAHQQAHALLHGGLAGAPLQVPAPLSGRVHVGGQGGAVSVDIAAHTVNATWVHETAPLASLDVFRFVRLQLPAEMSLSSAGKVDVFVNDAWMAQAPLIIDQAHSARVNLGVDPLVRVKSRTVDVQQADKGLLNNQVKISQRVRVQLHSQATEPVDVRIYERIPIDDKTEPDVVITLEGCEPPATQRDVGPEGQMKGGLLFVQRLMPREERVVEIRFHMVHASKMEIVGGARRDSSAREAS